MHKLIEKYANASASTLLLIAAAMAAVISVGVFIDGSNRHAEAAARYERVNAEVVSNPDIVYRGRSGHPAIIADIAYGEDMIRSAVPEQAKRGDHVTAYAEVATGELWRAPFDGARPVSNNIAAYLAATLFLGTSTITLLLYIGSRITYAVRTRTPLFAGC